MNERWLIPILTADEVRAASEAAIEEAKRQFEGIGAVPLRDVGAESVLDAWDRAAMALEDVFGPISLLNSVHPDQPVRDAADDALLAESSFLTDLFQNEA
ncbi:MAG TPA: hypothetical protein VLU46_04405, partial [Thermoanaerobaculia bacterium]|nr:hypothetical protein [Thermoanaerobaculia bacterium]